MREEQGAVRRLLNPVLPWRANTGAGRHTGFRQNSYSVSGRAPSLCPWFNRFGQEHPAFGILHGRGRLQYQKASGKTHHSSSLIKFCGWYSSRDLKRNNSEVLTSELPLSVVLLQVSHLRSKVLHPLAYRHFRNGVIDIDRGAKLRWRKTENVRLSTLQTNWFEKILTFFWDFNSSSVVDTPYKAFPHENTSKGPPRHGRLTLRIVGARKAFKT